MTASMKTHGARLTGEQLIARVTALRPWLREHQAEAEQQRRIPQESIELLDEAGVFSLTTLKRFGGADFTVRELHDIYRVLASGCGATSRMVWAAAGGNLWSFAFPDEVMAPVYQSPWTGNRTFALGGTSRRMSGTARQVDGGWVIKGAWPFATGSVHASHGYLAAFYDETDDAKVGMALVPKDQLIARNDWDAMGLAATGSQTVATDALFHASGASAIMKRQSLQLIARNCRAGSLHAAYSIDTWLENVGRSLCGSGSAPISTGVLERKPQPAGGALRAPEQFRAGYPHARSRHATHAALPGPTG